MTGKYQPEYRRKKRAVPQRDSPFPVPISSFTNIPCDENFWYQFTGYLRNDSVHVCCSGDIKYLYKMGFFGRGMLSRGAADFHQSSTYVYLPSESGSEPNITNIMKRRMYLRHRHWQKLHTSNTPADCDRSREDTEFDSDAECGQEYGQEHGQECIQEHGHEQDISHNTGDSASSASRAGQDMEENEETDSSIFAESVPNVCTDRDNEHKIESFDTWEDDADFWNNDQAKSSQTKPNTEVDNDVSGIINESVDAWDNCEADADFWGSSSTSAVSDSDAAKTRTDNSSVEPNNEGEGHETIDDQPPSKKRKTGEILSLSDNDNDETLRDKMLGASSNDCVELVKLSTVSEMCLSNSDSSKVKDTVVGCESTLDLTSTTHCDNKTENEPRFGANKENEPNVGNGTELPEKEFHPYCGLDEKDADFLVIDDSDVEDHVTFGPMKNGYHWKPTMKKDPYPYTEPLVLTAEEAYFLSYGLGCLTILDDGNRDPFTLKELWCRFCLRPSFLPCYAAYHYFRSRGWVPKSGIVFGTDFVLYKEGPPFFHGSYSVIVKTVYSGSYDTVEEYTKRSFTWAAFSGLQRITEHVAKTLLVCYVVIPPDLTEEEKKSPTCLSKIKIILQRYNRWVSSQEREQDRVTEIP